MKHVFLTSFGGLLGKNAPDEQNCLITEDIGALLDGMPLRGIDRISQIFIAALKQALQRREILIDPKASNDYGLFLGTEYGALDSIYTFDLASLRHGALSVNPSLFPNTVLNSPACQAEIKFGISGAVYTVSNGKTSSIDAMGLAYLFVKNEKCSLAIAGGGDELSKMSVKIAKAYHTARLGESGVFFLMESGSWDNNAVEVVDYRSRSGDYNYKTVITAVKRMVNDIIKDIDYTCIDFSLSTPFQMKENEEIQQKLRSSFAPVHSFHTETVNWMGASGMIQAIEEFKYLTEYSSGCTVSCIICCGKNKLSILTLKSGG